MESLYNKIIKSSETKNIIELTKEFYSYDEIESWGAKVGTLFFNDEIPTENLLNLLHHLHQSVNLTQLEKSAECLITGFSTFFQRDESSIDDKTRGFIAEISAQILITVEGSKKNLESLTSLQEMAIWAVKNLQKLEFSSQTLFFLAAYSQLGPSAVNFLHSKCSLYLILFILIIYIEYINK